ncbi:MAG: indolepyruvate ferredoxin oxidoreductase, beta subunit [Methanobacterium sp.]|jgi:indolepyruvate ferredoxin oxidoreductase beta subunit|uniref:indolepyruvate oxidoreductase subunit beta n=1 Tax=Methanobacterium sp. TaxID=2164 RepID=UPI0003C9253A|nr:indolepyruvate oxidoreductase subunit beta [Methanobacterium sp.]MDI3549255.1 indolepyruvate ferredoxin oxidoreductase, beta subunit [Methanobacterium sp.]CDG65414.1 Indolepyruvate oxidoreductase subunit IorB [Methanobacterium sp. MB1]
MNPYNIYISGVGGQGIIKTSVIMGEAAMQSGLSVVVGEIHGMSQRGGVVSTQMKIGDSHSPIIEKGKADLLLAFEPLEALRAINMINKDSYVVVNTSTIYPFNIKQSEYPYPELSVLLDEIESQAKKVIALDADGIAKKAGHILSVNMVLLGAATAIPGFPVDKETIIKSMQDNLPKKSLPINQEAFEEGFKFCQQNL